MLEKLPVAAFPRREDFRSRLAAGSGLTMAELVYSVVMALDSVKITADIELGGLDQLLNMQMCRRVIGAGWSRVPPHSRTTYRFLCTAKKEIRYYAQLGG